MDLTIQIFARKCGVPGELRYEFSEGDILIGVASVSRDESFYYIHFLSVMPDHRGKGYGSKVLESLCQTLNDKAIALELDRGSPFGFENLRTWYMRHGFVSTSGDWMMRLEKKEALDPIFR
ncbi:MULTISPECIES: GNAT family N-acetyltransferase [unclassified Coleofasciculus]|uniref:GNAT family N-acetyltransferase n=1 Tax=unclassified Coleofasciculus TaxID=2692782 RepID=UPI00187E8B25|nr:MULTISPECIES: GNAT family N-acetyltransferase [unclassified Coleofasciculus]MBE9127674.1 GNAT family N-acetyltransferase [Coleofasciculus sp. LEGE 07081]MBE9151012.1 GNAT family N-acetyltransferase [Coleofasciculus sp. LEGE 07092]